MSSNSRILVTNIAASTTEETLRDFFAFCGDIQAMHLYTNEPGKQETVIKFDGASASSTACLLNNALVDGNHINVKALVDETTTPSPKPPTPKPAPAGFFASLVESGKNIANNVAESAKQLDEKYQVTSTVSHTAQTVWTATVDTAHNVDEKLKISETTNKLIDDVKGQFGGQSRSATPDQKPESPKTRSAHGSPSPAQEEAPRNSPSQH